MNIGISFYNNRIAWGELAKRHLLGRELCGELANLQLLGGVVCGTNVWKVSQKVT